MEPAAGPRRRFEPRAGPDYLEEHNIQAVIPPRSNRLEQRDYDRDLYKDCDLVERFFNRIKHFRRVATSL